MIISVKKIRYVAVIILLFIIFASPYLFFGKTPFPSDYQVNFFAPWSVYPELGGPVKNNAQPDIITQIYPWKNFAIEEMKQGRMPFWNPFSFSGTPHLANYQSSVLFPLNILYFLPIEFIDVWGLLVVLQPLLAGIFMYFFARSLKMSSSGSLLSAISFMFCGYIVTWMGYATLGYAILPLPMALLAIQKYSEKKNPYWGILFSFTFIFSFFAGHFQTSIYFAAAVFAYLVYQTVITSQRKEYGKLFIYFFIGILLTLPQVLPSIELYLLSARSSIFQKIEAIPWNYITTLIAPDVFGNPVTRNNWYGHYAEWSGYVGVIALSFALYPFLFLRNRVTAFFMGMSVIAFLLAFNTPLLDLLVHLKIPVLSTSSASRIIVLFSFSVCILAGLGFDAVMKTTIKRKIVVWLAVVGIVFVGLSSLGIMHAYENSMHVVAIKNIIPNLAIIFVVIGCGLSLIFIKSTKVKIFVVIILLIAASADMFRFATKWQSFSERDLAFRHVGIIDFYQKQNHIDRFIGMSGGEDALSYRIPITTGYDPLYKGEYGELMNFLESGGSLTAPRSTVGIPLNGKFTPTMLDFLGIKYVVHKKTDKSYSWAFPFKKYPADKFTKAYEDKRYVVYENTTVMPRVYLVNSTVVIPDRQKIPIAMMNMDLRNSAIIETDLTERAVGTGKAVIKKYIPGSITINTTATDKSFLILTDNYYPGWKATVNGKSQEIYKTNYAFMGVIVPRGETEIVLSYIPASFLIGVYCMLLGIVVIFLLNMSLLFKSKK